MPRRKAVTNNKNAGEANAQPTAAKRGRKSFHLKVPMRRQIVGNVLVCGTGDCGQLGLGEDIKERKRLTVVEIPNPVDVCAGGMHSLVLTESGDIYSFGCNDEDALGRDTSKEGSEFLPALVHLPGKAVRMSVGDSHSACILEDGSLYAWGTFRDSHGTMGLTIDGNKRVPTNLLPGTVCCSIASGADHLVILSTRGKVYTVGCAEQGQLGRITARSVGGEGRRGKHDLLRPDQLIVLRTKPFEAIWATSYCTFLRESETDNIWAVGLNNFRQLACENNEDMILHPIKTTLKDIKQISGGMHHTLFLKNDKRCYVVGRPEYGRLGLGSKEDVVEQLTPPNKLSDNIVHVECAEISSYAITEDGKIYSWGMGTNFQLGVGDGDDSLEPVLVTSKNTQNRKMLLASGGGQHCLFLGEVDRKEPKENTPATATRSKKDNTPLPTPNTIQITNTDEKGNSKTAPKNKDDEIVPAPATSSKRDNTPLPTPNTSQETNTDEKGNFKTAPKNKDDEIVPTLATSSKKDTTSPPHSTSTEETGQEGKANSKTSPKKAADKRLGPKKE